MIRINLAVFFSNYVTVNIDYQTQSAHVCKFYRQNKALSGRLFSWQNAREMMGKRIRYVIHHLYITIANQLWGLMLVWFVS